MQIDKVIAVHWGQLEIREYKVHPRTLLTGSTGSGKTTLADAVQTVMTATKNGLFAYNPGQEESNQHGKHGKTYRTLESYILGADEAGYARPNGAHGHVAVVFTPSPGESAQPFTAILSASASLDVKQTAAGTQRAPRLDVLRLFTIEGQVVTLEDFVQYQSASELEIVPADKIYTRLRAKYPRVEEHKDDKGKYLARLYALFRGLQKVSRAEAEQAARTFSRFMAYKPIESVDQFVKSQVLVEADQSQQIEHISEMMRNVNELRHESERLTGNIALLEAAEAQGDEYLAGWREIHRNKLWLAMRSVFEIDEEVGHLNTLAGAHAQSLTELEQLLVDYEREARELQARRDRIQQKRSEHSAAQEKDRLESNLEAAATDMRDELMELGKQLGQLNHTMAGVREVLAKKDVLDHYKELAPLLEKLRVTFDDRDGDRATKLSALINRVAASQDMKVDLNLADSLREQAAGMDARIRKVSDLCSNDDNSLLSLANQLLGQLRAEQKAVRENADELRQRIANIKGHGRIEYPGAVAMALERIQRELPEANPQVLCDLIEVKNPEWQPVIEGYMGGRRFSILVEPEYEAQAASLARRTRAGSASVIQGSLARKDAERTPIGARSMVGELNIGHPIARAYVVASFGSVNKVDTVEELRHERRGISLDGHGSGGYAMFDCALSDGELTFGKNAREKRGRSIERDLELVLHRQQQVDRALTELTGAIQSLRKVQPLAIESSANAAARFIREITDLLRQIEDLDMSELADLEAELAEVNRAQQALNVKIQQAHEKKGAAGKMKEQAETAAKWKQEQMPAAKQNVEVCRDAITALSLTDPATVPNVIFAELETLAASPETSGKDIGRRIDQAARQLDARRSRFIDEVVTYNQTARAAEQVQLDVAELLAADAQQARTHAAMVGGLAQVRERLRQQRDTGLAEVLDQLKAAQRDVHSAFTSDFCQMLHGRLQEGERTLKYLNKELETHRFGNARYYFGAKWVPEFKRYYDFFEAIMKIDDLGEQRDLFTSKTLSEEHIAIRDELIDMLVNSEGDAARRKLLEISDYRRYHHYEIYKQTATGEPIPLSTYGTGSGGQLETPSYVIRAAAVTSAFRHREGKAHLRTVLIDESFAKMDERHARDVLNYLTETLGFQVLFIMPSKASGSFMDMVDGQIKFAKVKSPAPVGELAHMILSQHQAFDRENMEVLWQRHREQVRLDAERKFGLDDGQESDETLEA